MLALENRPTLHHGRDNPAAPARTATPPTPAYFATAHRRADGMLGEFFGILDSITCTAESAEAILSMVKTIRLTTAEQAWVSTVSTVDITVLSGAGYDCDLQGARRLIAE